MNELPEPKIGDDATILIPGDERHHKDLWWWDGKRAKVIDVHDRNFRVRTTDGYTTWLHRRHIAVANREVRA